MDWINLFQFYLFDFDGVLVDTEPLHYAAYETVCHKWNIPWKYGFEQYCNAAHGESLGFKKLLFSDYPELVEQGPSWDLIAKEKKEIYTELLKTSALKLMPGVEQLLAALQEQNLPSCVVTNSPRAHVEMIKELLPALRSIPHWITREDYENPKPSPEGYLKAIDLFAPPQGRIIGFEDTLKGFQALAQTPAHPILLCPADREHVGVCLALGGRHFESFERIPEQLEKWGI